MVTAETVRDEIIRYIEAECKRYGSTEAVRPGHRVPFEWPPAPVSFDYHVSGTQFQTPVTIQIDGEDFDAQIAETPHGVFGRIEHLWNEARGDSVDAVLEKLKSEACCSSAKDRFRSCWGRKIGSWAALTRSDRATY